MTTEYTYVIATDFPHSDVNIGRWVKEIRDSAIVTTLNHCRVEEVNAVASFDDALSADDEDILDTIVSSHSAEPVTRIEPALTEDLRQIVRADPRPEGTGVYFTSVGDTPSGIGDGNMFCWDFSNADNDDPSPPAGKKRKIIDIQFSEELWIKDGWLFYEKVKKGTEIKVSIVCPDGQYYINHLGVPTQASGDTEIYAYMPTMLLIGTNYIGTPFSSEGALDALPTNYFLRAIITVPDTDTDSYGHAMVKAYRNRTMLLPGESI